MGLRSDESPLQALLATVAMLALPLNADADVLIRMGGVWADPEDNVLTVPKALIFAPATSASFKLKDAGPALSADVTWLFSKHLAVEFWMNTPLESALSFRAEGIAGGTTVMPEVEAGKIDVTSPMLNLQWHFLPTGYVRPYVGAGLAYTMYHDISPAALTADDAIGWTLGVGLDMGREDSGVFLNAFAKYVNAATDARATVHLGPGAALPIFPPPQASPQGSNRTFDSTLNLNPLLIGVKFGYRFGNGESP